MSSVDIELLHFFERKFAALSDKIDASDKRADERENIASEKRAIVHRKMEEFGLEQQSLRHDFKALEAKVDAAEPALKFYGETRTAGKIGRKLVIIGAVLLSGVAYIGGKWDAIAGALRALTGK